MHDEDSIEYSAAISIYLNDGTRHYQAVTADSPGHALSLARTTMEYVASHGFYEEDKDGVSRYYPAHRIMWVRSVPNV